MKVDEIKLLHSHLLCQLLLLRLCNESGLY